MKAFIKKSLKKFLHIAISLLFKSKVGNFILDTFIDTCLSRQILVKHKNVKMIFCTPNALCYFRAKTFSVKEPETIKWIDKFVSNSIFWDIGANVGLYSIYAGKKGHKIISFEPSFFNLESLSRNINLNNLNENVIVFPLALNDKTLLSKFHLSNIIWGSAHSTFDKKFISSGENMNIKFSYKTLGVKIDEIIKIFNMKQPRYIKIDVDGIEHLILKGGKKTIGKTKSILIEVSKKFEAHHYTILNILNSLGFKLKNEFGSEKYYKNQIWEKI
jgi:FkbM family methyltransferase